MQQVLNDCRLSVVVPVYGNEGEITNLLSALRWIQDQVDGRSEAILVVDGSPDRSLAELLENLPDSGVNAKLVSLTRNFGSFAAIRTGLGIATGNSIGVMAADLQEPKEIMLEFLDALENDGADVVVGVRTGRADGVVSSLFSRIFWGFYRRFIVSDIPKGGVDVFGLSASARDRLLLMNERNSSLVAQLFWIGGVRKVVPYFRAERQIGRSGWTFGKKFTYMLDSIFAFTDLPLRLLMHVGALGLIVSTVLGLVTVIGKFTGTIHVPGYALTMLTILTFGALNSLGLGFVGMYAWRAYENTKQRPQSIIQFTKNYENKGNQE